MSQVNYTVVFDGECSVCHRFVARLRRWDRGGILEIVPSQDSGVVDRFPWITPEAYEASIQLVASDGTTWSGASALEKLLAILPRGRWLGWVLRVPFVRPTVERIYGLFAGNRHRMGCRIP
jgi:predicted DCC family thiol-disulfide oxidoreductase YuxK